MAVQAGPERVPVGVDGGMYAGYRKTVPSEGAEQFARVVRTSTKYNLKLKHGDTLNAVITSCTLDNLREGRTTRIR